jgi:hypothetical protein
MATVASLPTQSSATRTHDDHIMDTRTPSPGPALTGGSTTTRDDKVDSDVQQDLSSEVALLSTKLVNAINFQTSLDDSLQQTRHELEQSRQQCHALSTENDRITAMITSGILMKKSVVDESISRLRSELAAEKVAREAAEKAKKQTENELENLTTELFEEANAMVAVARKDVEAMERKNQQLRSQLQDTEMVMASQQDQLRELKESMEKAQAEALHSRDPSMPTTPTASSGAAFEALHSIISNNALDPDQAPDHPLHFAHLVSPVLRHDTAAYSEFTDLLISTRRTGAHSRNNSSSMNSQSSPGQSQGAPGTSSPVMPGGFSFSTSSSPSSSTFSGAAIPPLKDSRFYKRILSEDLEPTLRLDIAPGLSFLSRRTVLSSLLSGSLSVEVFPPNKHYYACALCGESRRDEPHVRKHHFRTSEDDTAPKPLCDYCLGRLRATCDFIAFLRMVREGHWKCDSEDEQKSAWEESVRLRERMFWSRLGGGVVPSFQHLLGKNAPPTPLSPTAAKGERQSLESIPENGNAAGTSEDEKVEQADFVTPPSSTHPQPVDAIPEEVPPQANSLDLGAPATSSEEQSSADKSDEPTPSDKQTPTTTGSATALATRPPPQEKQQQQQQQQQPEEFIKPVLKKTPSSLSLSPAVEQTSSLPTPISRSSSTTSIRSTATTGGQKTSSVLARVRAMEAEAKRPITPP